MAAELVEVVAVPAPSPVRSSFTERSVQMPMKPIPEQVFATSGGGEQDGRTSKSTGVEQQSVSELRAPDDSRLVQTNAPVAVPGGIDEVGAEVEARKGAVVASAQVCHIDDNNGCSPLTSTFHPGFT